MLDRQTGLVSTNRQTGFAEQQRDRSSSRQSSGVTGPSRVLWVTVLAIGVKFTLIVSFSCLVRTAGSGATIPLAPPETKKSCLISMKKCVTVQRLTWHCKDFGTKRILSTDQRQTLKFIV